MLIPTYFREDGRDCLSRIYKISSKGYAKVELKYIFSDMTSHLIPIVLVRKRYYGEKVEIMRSVNL